MYAGGTIDSEWVAEHDTAETRSQSTVQDYLNWIAKRNGFAGVRSTILALKDSRQISLSDRKEFADKIVESPANRILLTSGTYLMPEIARPIAKHLLASSFANKKRIIITGSLIPMKGFEMSDGGFNLGMSVALLGENKLPVPIVLAVINGQAIPAVNLEKDLTTATFAKDENNLLGYDDYLIVPAGGTIDFQPSDNDALIPGEESLISYYLRKNVKTVLNPTIAQPILKDSRSLNEEDIKEILEIIQTAKHDKIIITCGLFRIGELRDRIFEFLQENSKQLGSKTIIMTGSRLMLCMAGFSDAPFNLGFAHGMLGILDPGVYVALAGRIYENNEDPLEHTYTKEELANNLEQHS